MNAATGDDLSINASYAAEPVSILFRLFMQETAVPDACGRWHREAVRAEQLAYKLMVCSETLQTLGRLANVLAPRLSPQATALISCLYLESSSIYPALRSAVDETAKIGLSKTWGWLKSIEHQDWLRSHLACLEGLARVLHLALSSHAPPQHPDHGAFMTPARQRSLLNAQLSSAAKRFFLACETCHLNLRTLEATRKAPWQELPWRMIKPAATMEQTEKVFSPICRWLLELGRKCGREKIDTIVDNWDTDPHKLKARLIIDRAASDAPEPVVPQGERRGSSVRWVDNEGGRLERGSSLLAMNVAAQQQQNGRTLTTRPSTSNVDRNSPSIVDEDISKRQSDNLLALPCSHKDCSKHAMQPPLFADQSNLSKHLKLVHRQTLLHCPYPECFRKGEQSFKTQQDLQDHRRAVHQEPQKWQEAQTIFEDDLPALHVVPPSRSSTPAIDIPQRKKRLYTRVEASPEAFSPLSSPADRIIFSPSSNLATILELSALRERNIKPAVYALLRQTPAVPLKSCLKGAPDLRSRATKEYYSILDRLVNDVIQPANRLILGAENDIAWRERRRLVKEADRMLTMMEHWTGEERRERMVERDHRESRRAERHRAFSLSPVKGERSFGRSY